MPDIPPVMHTDVKTKRCHLESVSFECVLGEESERFLWQVQTLTTNDLIYVEIYYQVQPETRREPRILLLFSLIPVSAQLAVI